MYDNKGNSGFMTGTYHDGSWIFLGDNLKFTGGFKNDDKEFSGIWLKLVDGKFWKYFMEITLRKGI